MNNRELENELSKIRQKISELPIGYISKKTINGKTKQHLQWTENGKKKSKYVDDELAEELRAKIELRRELQKREKELNVVDHQLVNMKFDNGVCAHLTMTGFKVMPEKAFRRIRCLIFNPYGI